MVLTSNETLSPPSNSSLSAETGVLKTSPVPASGGEDKAGTPETNRNSDCGSIENGRRTATDEVDRGRMAAAVDIEVGALTFSDASEYKGTLKNGIPDGLGQCVWADGNKYDGEWRNGTMHGFGTFLWTSGQRYDGEWKEGRRNGIGIKMYADGSTYDGFWKDGAKHGVGLFRPAPSVDASKRALKKQSSKAQILLPKSEEQSQQQQEASAAADAEAELANEETLAANNNQHHPLASAAAAAAAAAASSRPSGIPSDAASADSTMGGTPLQLDRKQVYIRKFEDGKLMREDKLGKEDIKLIFGDLPPDKSTKKRRKRRWVKNALGMGKKLQQRQGQLLYKGMPGYDLMTRLQLGIRHSVGSLNQRQQQLVTRSRGMPAAEALKQQQGLRKLGPMDFEAKNKVFFPSDGSSKTPAHPSSDFKWKDYSPSVFRNLRLMWGVQDAEYMLSLAGSKALWQLNSPGKSGCLFFLSDDEKFLVKTMRKNESKILIEMLPDYYRHMEQNEDSLITRFYGVYGVKQVHGRTVRFVVMSNIFCTDRQIHRKFDLKGSTEGRTSGSADPNDPKTVFKDLDLDVTILLAKPHLQRLTSQLQSDAEFLKRIGVMDYSLLLGIHFVGRGVPSGYLSAQASNRLLTPQMTRAREGTTEQQEEGAPTTPASGRISQGGIMGGKTPTSGGGVERFSSSGGQNGRKTAGGGGAVTRGSDPGGEGSTPGGGAPPSPSSLLTTTLSLRLENELLEAAARRSSLDAVATTQDNRARNFDVFTNRDEVSRHLTLIEQRMKEASYPEQRISDVLGLAKLRILGDTLKASKGPKPAAVLKAMQQWRQDALGLKPAQEVTSIPEGAATLDGGSGEENDCEAPGTAPRCEAPGTAPRTAGGSAAPTSFQGEQEVVGYTTPPSQARSQGQGGHLGISVPAVALHRISEVKKGSGQDPQAGHSENVILYMGIIDILQDYSTRKLFERGFKVLRYDGMAISVAPPKLYARRFFDFMTTNVFKEGDSLQHPYLKISRYVGRQHPDPTYGFIAEEGDEEDDDDDNTSVGHEE